MDTPSHLSEIKELDSQQRFALEKGGFTTVSSVLFVPPHDVEKRCRLTPSAAKQIIETVCKALHRPPRPLDTISDPEDHTISTGDAALDEMLNGGIRTGMVWELVGESASGKTQLALHLSLHVQAPVAQGGLLGSACYLTTHAALPTPRLVELSQQHSVLSSVSCTLSNIQTIETRSVEVLLFVLSTALPSYIESPDRNSLPVKLVVLDSLADLFSEDKASTNNLRERSKNLAEISSRLHTLANKYQIAVVVVNQVVDVWDRDPDADRGQPGELIYAEHARLFNRADSIPGEDRKSAALGLVWANQVNARIMLTRTSRRRHLDELPEDARLKRRRVEGPGSHVPGAAAAAAAAQQDQPVLIRRLTVLYSSISEPASIDFVITPQGIQTINDSIPPSRPTAIPPTSRNAAVSRIPTIPSHARPLMAEVTLLDVASAENELQTMPGDHPSSSEHAPEEDEDSYYWDQSEDPIPEDLDLDAWERSIIQSSSSGMGS